MDTLENSATRSDAGVMLQAILSISFRVFSWFWKCVLPEINDTQKFLQTKCLELEQCAIKLAALKTFST